MSGPTSARPTGITILAILAAIVGVLQALGGIAVFAVAGTLFGGAGALLGLAFIALAALAIAFAWGAWTMQSWAWPLGMVLAGASILVAVLYIIGGGSIATNAVDVVVAGVIIYYLNQPAIRSLFGR